MITATFAFVGGLLGSMIGAYIFYSPNNCAHDDEDILYRNSGHHGKND